MRRYELIIYWSTDDETFVVEVPELPGCMADGRTYDEAVKNAEVAIQEWVDTAKQLGREVLWRREDWRTPDRWSHGKGGSLNENHFSPFAAFECCRKHPIRQLSLRHLLSAQVRTSFCRTFRTLIF